MSPTRTAPSLRRVLDILGLLLFACTSSLHAQDLSFEAARSLAAQRAESVRLQERSLEQARLGETAARAARLPRVDLTASASHLSETGGLTFAIPGLLQRTISFGDGDVADLALSASAPLFTGFRLQSRIDMAADQVRIAEEGRDGTAFDAAHDAGRAYRRAQAAERAVQVQNEQARLVRGLLEQRRALLREGQAIPLDTLLLSTRLTQVEVDREVAQNLLADALTQVEELCQLPPGVRILPFEPRPLPPLPSEDSLLALARRSRADVRTLDASRLLAEHGLTAASASLYPSLAASAALRAGRPGVDQVRNEWMSWWTVGVRLEWNLWAWGEDRATLQRQRIDIDKADLRIAQVVLRVRTTLSSLRRALDLRTRSIALLQGKLRQEQERLAIVTARLHEGQGTTTELLDAETALSSTRLALEQARIEQTMVVEDIAWTVGVAPDRLLP